MPHVLLLLLLGGCATTHLPSSLQGTWLPLTEIEGTLHTVRTAPGCPEPYSYELTESQVIRRFTYVGRPTSHENDVTRVREADGVTEVETTTTHTRRDITFLELIGLQSSEVTQKDARFTFQLDGSGVLTASMEGNPGHDEPEGPRILRHQGRFTTTPDAFPAFTVPCAPGSDGFSMPAPDALQGTWVPLIPSGGGYVRVLPAEGCVVPHTLHFVGGTLIVDRQGYDPYPMPLHEVSDSPPYILNFKATDLPYGTAAPGQVPSPALLARRDTHPRFAPHPEHPAIWVISDWDWLAHTLFTNQPDAFEAVPATCGAVP